MNYYDNFVGSMDIYQLGQFDVEVRTIEIELHMVLDYLKFIHKLLVDMIIHMATENEQVDCASNI